MKTSLLLLGCFIISCSGTSRGVQSTPDGSTDSYTAPRRGPAPRPDAATDVYVADSQLPDLYLEHDTYQALDSTPDLQPNQIPDTNPDLSRPDLPPDLIRVDSSPDLLTDIPPDLLRDTSKSDLALNLSLGTTCISGNDCNSGFCTNGVCCQVSICMDTCPPGGSCVPYNGFTCAPYGTCRGY